MAMDLTEPIPALVLTPRRLLRIAMFVGASGVAALLVAVGVWSGRIAAYEAGFAADRTRRHVVEARCGCSGGSACTRARPPRWRRPPPPPLPPLHLPPVPTRRSCGTPRWPPSPRPPRQGRPRLRCRPRVLARPFRRSACPAAACPPSTGMPSAQSLGLQNVNWAGLLFGQGCGGARRPYRRHHWLRDRDREQCAESGGQQRVQRGEHLDLGQFRLLRSRLWPYQRWPPGRRPARTLNKRLRPWPRRPP